MKHRYRDKHGNTDGYLDMVHDNGQAARERLSDATCTLVNVRGKE